MVPWDYDLVAAVLATPAVYHGVFLSNGPGDPTSCNVTVDNVRRLLQAKAVPVLGVCLGHQVLALAAGARTAKLAHGHRGANVPCQDARTRRCYITAQNHGFEVRTDTLPDTWEVSFVNANDGTNEGIIHKHLPYVGVQFHPEGAPGPEDTAHVLDDFVTAIRAVQATGHLQDSVRPACVPDNWVPSSCPPNRSWRPRRASASSRCAVR